MVENEGRLLTGSLVESLYVSGMTNFEVPQRPARDHVIVNPDLLTAASKA